MISWEKQNHNKIIGTKYSGIERYKMQWDGKLFLTIMILNPILRNILHNIVIYIVI